MISKGCVIFRRYVGSSTILGRWARILRETWGSWTFKLGKLSIPCWESGHISKGYSISVYRYLGIHRWKTNGYWFAKLECPPQRLSTFSALHGQNPTKSNGVVRVSGTIPRKDDSDFKSVQVLGIYSSNVRGVTEPTRQNCPVSFRGT